MKKDKEKKPLPEATAVGGPEISSATLALQLLNKEKNIEAEKKESTAEAAKVRCKTCFKEVAPKRLCSGHGGGGGGDSANADKTSEAKASSGEDKSLTKSKKIVDTTGEMIGEFHAESGFDPEIIAELIAKALLLVESDRESMTLTIKLLCQPNLLTEEQRDELKMFMEAIIKEFNEFKEVNNLLHNCIKINQDEKGNILFLCIIMPTLALYDAFIQRLANNLVPIPNLKAQEKDEVTKDQRLGPNPFSMEPKPSNFNKDKLSKREEIDPNKDIEPEKAGEDEQKTFNPSPFNMKPW